jgi:hypothetical protein
MKTTKEIIIGLSFTVILFFIMGYCIMHSENSGMSNGVRDDLNYQWSHIKALELKIDSLKMVIVKMNNNQSKLNNQFLQHISTQTDLNKEMFKNAQMQLQFNDIISKRVDSK